ncbi:hypothetical protein [Actinocrispum sp. NPDC049592]|uniref:hypothetical protein n=1 Tax=Actinocrispum sp. NPDC049592 TaxID=3154835 RepID=UPI00342BD74D
MATHQRGQREIVDFLVKTYASFVYHSDESALDALPRDRRHRIRELRQTADHNGSSVEVLRLIADHVAGMTDSYAAMIHKRLSGQVSGEFNKFV